jgi:hypothetical protein
MSRALLFSVFIFSTSCPAADFWLQDKNCAIAAAESRDVNIKRNLGALTIDFLNAQTPPIPFEGDEHSLSSIDGQGSWLETVSNREFRAWGWCFMINGDIPETMPGETYLQSPTDLVLWFYGFAKNLDGVWVSQCENPCSE